MKITLKNNTELEFSEFELNDKNLRKININYDGKDGEGLWAYFSDVDVKRYDNNERTSTYSIVVVLANAPVMFYPNNFWGAFVPIKLEGSTRATLNVADLDGTPLFHSKRMEMDDDAEPAEDETDELPTQQDNKMKTITLQTAVALAVKDLLALGPFSAYDVTQLIRVQVDKDYILSDVEDIDWDDDDEEFTPVSHDDVKVIVVELFDNGLIDATRGYGSKAGNSFVEYTPNVAPVVTSLQTPNVAQTSTIVDPLLLKIQSYLGNKGSATIKQIQSALKIKGVTCEQIAKLLQMSSYTQSVLADSVSKVLVKG